jgi:hypothetical protein
VSCLSPLSIPSRLRAAQASLLVLLLPEKGDTVSVERRLQVIEHIIGKSELEQAEDELVAKEAKACAEGEHDWNRNWKYDLQGGKWGIHRCRRCGEEHHWSV